MKKKLENFTWIKKCGKVLQKKTMQLQKKIVERETEKSACS